ncbi:MAG: PIN domain-containing protein [Bacteroidetes bacterium]|nr:PIN domain-containing protein [Bacteroidota bacterium]
MKIKILLDTNILLYALDVASQYHASVTKILTDPSSELFTTSKNISEYFAVCSKLNIPFSDSLIFYRSVCENARILFPDAGSLAIFETLLQKYQPKGNRVFDLEIVAIGLANQLTTIATANFKDFIGITEISIQPV